MWNLVYNLNWEILQKPRDQKHMCLGWLVGPYYYPLHVGNKEKNIYPLLEK